MLKRFIGDKQFYKYVFALMLPILVQNGITNFVNMLDNLMVGRVGQIEMIGVSVTNQLIFVYTLCVFGAVSGAGIFGAQFAGSGDVKGMRDTFRFKIILGLIITALATALFVFFGEDLIKLYLTDEENAENALASLGFGRDYLKIMLIGFVPSALVQCYASSMRENGNTFPPMVAGVAAVLVNLFFNYCLIFGNLGFPELGVSGAAVATVISRFVELVIIAIWAFARRSSNKFIVGAFKSLRVPAGLVKKIIIKGLPLMANETLWALGMAFVNQCYSKRGMEVVAANNILQTFFNVFSVAFMAVGVAIGIILGQMLGAEKTKEAKDTSVKLIAFSVIVSLAVGAVFAVCAEFIPEFYNIEPEVKELATTLMLICAITMPLDAFAHASYFTLRSGGQAFVTFVFDSGFVWVVSAGFAFAVSRYTALPIIPFYALCQSLNILKCILGFIFVKRGKWIKNIVK